MPWLSSIVSEKTASVIRWIAATAGGALIGVIVTSIYQSARPSVNVIAVQPSVAANKQFITDTTPVPVPPSLASATEKSFWVAAMRDSTMPYKRFEDTLDEDEHDLNKYFEDWNRFKVDLPRLRALLERAAELSENEKNELFDLWERNDGFIFGALRGEYNRGTVTLPHKQHSGTPFFRLVEETTQSGNTIWMVSRKGGLYASYLFPQRKQDLAVNKEVAEDLAFLDAPVLMSFLDVCERPENGAGEANKETLDEISRARRQISRWTVQIAISNAGDSPIAFLPQALLRVETSDLMVAGKRWGKPVEIPIEHRDENSELAPIYLEKGSAKLVKYSSTAYIKDIEPGASLLQAFDLGGFDCYVQLSTAGGGLLTRTKYRTPTTRFASSNTASQ